MRGQFENMPEVHKKLKDLHPTIVWFSDQENEYASSFDGFQSMVIWLNGAWYTYQEQQKKIDAITKQRDSFIKAHHIAMNDVCENKDKIDEVNEKHSEEKRILHNVIEMNQAKIDELQARFDGALKIIDGMRQNGAYKALDILKGNKDEK